MQKIMLAAACTLALGGCATSTQINTSASRNTLYGITNAYGVVLATAGAYKSLALCPTGSKWTLANPCAQRSIVVRLQAADKRAVTAINRADAFLKQYPEVGATNLIAAAQSAVSAYQAVLGDAGVK